ncbi:MAG: AraC family transcriptional regulator ligand-binding domain-containing protein [Myxococcaceae bacterium]
MLRASLLRPFADRLSARGGDPQALAKRLGIDDRQERGAAGVTAAQVRSFCEQAARLAQDPGLGLNAALERPPGSFGMVEIATRSAPDLKTALQFRVDFSPLLNEGVEVYFEADEHEGRFGFQLAGDREGLGRHVNEFRLASTMLLFRALIGARFAPLRAWFSNTAAETREALEVLLRTTDLKFNQPDCGIAVSLRDLSRRSRRADPMAFEYWRKQAERRLPKQRETPFADQLRRRLREQLAEGAPEMEKLAKQLHMSRRTLHRRLADEQLNFQTVVDELRRDLAERAVLHSDRGTEELALSLGYADVPAFLRAFKRWTGMNPTGFRQRSLTS